MQNQPEIIIPVCPFLGVKEDPNTSIAYPTMGNYCYHCRIPTVPSLDHQRSVCQTEGFEKCSVYQSPKESPFPFELKSRSVELRRRKKETFRLKVAQSTVGFVALVLIIVFRAPILGFAGRGLTLLLPNTPTAWVMPTSALTSMPTRVLTATLPVTSVRSTIVPTNVPATKKPPLDVSTQPSLLPSPTRAPTLTPVPHAHTLDSPFLVGEHRLVIHRVKAGENMDILVRDYATSADVIRSLNKISGGIWENSVLVIEMDTVTVSPELPAFLPYLVTDPTIPIEVLAIRLETDIDLLKYYNACTDNCQLTAGDWVIIPITTP